METNSEAIKFADDSGFRGGWFGSALPLLLNESRSLRLLIRATAVLRRTCVGGNPSIQMLLTPECCSHPASVQENTLLVATTHQLIALSFLPFGFSVHFGFLQLLVAHSRTNELSHGIKCARLHDSRY